MAILASILPIVSRASTLALDLYQLAAAEPNSTKDLNKLAKTVSGLAFIVKHVGTVIKENDRLPSHEAIETLQDIIDQCTTTLAEIESAVATQDTWRDTNKYGDPPNWTRRDAPNCTTLARLQYLGAHLNALRLTLSVMLQTLHTTQSVIWARVRPTISPQQGAAAVANEKNQLETLIIEQQMCILIASKIYEPARPDAGLLMEQDSSQSVMAVASVSPPKPTNLYHYQDRFIASLDISDAAEEDWLPSVCSVSRSQVERLLERWTTLPDFEQTLRDKDKKLKSQKRDAQQPSVESDSEEEIDPQPRYASSGARLATPAPRRQGSVQPLFTETSILPFAFDAKFGPAAPLSPASSYSISPRSAGNFLPIPLSQTDSAPVSPRTSISSLPVEAAAAVEAQEKDDDISLEIPWTLRTSKHWWKFIDAKLVDCDADIPKSVVFSERTSWTEVMASWVCKEAIQEAGYHVEQLSKETPDGRRTKFETCFRIEQPLTFAQVHRLVERTVEIYRQTHKDEAKTRETTKRPSAPKASKADSDRDRTPVANQHPPLERTTTSYPFPPPPPPLDRSVSLPTTIPRYGPNTHGSSPHLSMPQAPYSPHIGAYSPQAPPYSPNTQPVPISPNQPPYSPSLNRPLNNTWPHPNTQAQLGPQSPLRHSYTPSSRHDYNSSTSNTSDSDNVSRSRKSRPRSRSRSRRPETSHKKKGSGHGSAGTVGALMGIGGLTALLDGLSGL